MQKRGEKLFWGSVGGCEPQQNLVGNEKNVMR